MADFSVILAKPEVRKIVQENLLTREFHDALFPRLQFRGEAEYESWPNGVGDHMIFTGVGLVKPKQKPLAPNQDPTPSTYTYEQWEARLKPYGDSIDVHLPTDAVAIASLFMRHAKQLGMSAGQSLNYIVRNRYYNAALQGHTVADGAQNATSNLRVKRLNGFTRARNPALAAGEPVQFAPVSANNPLAITAAGTAVNVIGFAADTAGDETGPGVLTLSANVTVADRDAVLAKDRTNLVRVGGGTTVDAINGGNTLSFPSIRSIVSRFWTNNVPEYADGSFHAHLDPVSQSQIFSDAEFQRLQQGVPDSVQYRDFALTKALGCVFFKDTECPTPETWLGNVDGTFAGQAWTEDDPFAGEVFNSGGTTIHRPIFIGAGGLKEYQEPIDGQQTEAGMNGRMMDIQVSNNGVEVMTRGIKMIIRSPLDRLQQNVAVSWYFKGTWTHRTDAATGGNERIKRVGVIEHGE